MSYRIALSVLALMFITALPAQGGVATLKQSVTIDKGSGDATFTIDFPHTPDFYTLDASNRPVDSFQIDISADPAPGNPLASITSIIRGNEIHFNHSLPIRASSPPALTDPNSGGWGPIIKAIPFSVTGNEVKFTAPLIWLGGTDGRFVYQAFTMDQGVINAQAQGQSQAVPLPSAFNAVLLMLGAIMSIATIKTVFASRNQSRPAIGLPWTV